MSILMARNGRLAREACGPGSVTAAQMTFQKRSRLDHPFLIKFRGILAFISVASLGMLAPGLETTAQASMLLANGVGAVDQATNGSFVAEPCTPESALFENPAGLVGFERTTLAVSGGIATADTEVSSREAGYDSNDHPFAVLPSAAVSIPVAPGWRAGVGLYGTVGTKFDFGAGPPTVNADFLTELSIASIPLALAREVTPNLWVGAEVIGIFGYLRNRYTLVDPLGDPLPIKYTLRGPGIQAMFGGTWKPNDVWSLGLGVTTPGAVWLDGSTLLADGRKDVDGKLRMPLVVWSGATRHLGERADVSLSLRWTDSSVFQRSRIKYGGIEVPFVPDANDEWRVALGTAIHLTRRTTLLAGTSYASRIVGNKGVSPLMYDGEDVKISLGASHSFGALELHVTTGYAFEFSRNVPAGDALVLPGSYRASGPGVILGMTYEFGTGTQT